MKTIQLNSIVGPIPQGLLDKHFLRKHGAGAYYGQPPKPSHEIENEI